MTVRHGEAKHLGGLEVGHKLDLIGARTGRPADLPTLQLAKRQIVTSVTSIKLRLR